jgi:hypothetical protein
MTPAELEILNESVARGEYDAWECEAAARRLIVAGNACMDRSEWELAYAHFEAAAGIARWIDEQVNGFLKEFQARRSL